MPRRSNAKRSEPLPRHLARQPSAKERQNRRLAAEQLKINTLLALDPKDSQQRRQIKKINREMRRQPEKITDIVKRVRYRQTLDQLDMAGVARPEASKMSVRQALHACFYELGGDRTFAKWAYQNKGDFYKLWARMLPVEIAGDPDRPIKVEHSSNEVARRIAFVLMQGLNEEQQESVGMTIDQDPEESFVGNDIGESK